MCSTYNDALFCLGKAKNPIYYIMMNEGNRSKRAIFLPT